MPQYQSLQIVSLRLQALTQLTRSVLIFLSHIKVLLLSSEGESHAPILLKGMGCQLICHSSSGSLPSEPTFEGVIKKINYTPITGPYTLMQSIY